MDAIHAFYGNCCENILRGGRVVEVSCRILSFYVKTYTIVREDQNSLIVPQVGHCVRYQFNADPSWTLLQTNGGVVFFVFVSERFTLNKWGPRLSTRYGTIAYIIKVSQCVHDKEYSLSATFRFRYHSW